MLHSHTSSPNHLPGEVPEKHPTVVAAESLRERLAERCLDPKDEIRSRAVELIMDAALKSAPCLVWGGWARGTQETGLAEERLHRSV